MENHEYNLRPRRPDDDHGSSLFSTIIYTALYSMDPDDIWRFRKDRKKNDAEVAKKQKEVWSLQVASNKVSFDQTLLNYMHLSESFRNNAPSELAKDMTSEHFQAFLRAMVSRSKTDDVDTKTIHAALNGWRVEMTIRSPEARIFDFLNRFLSRLEVVGFGDFKESNHKKGFQTIAGRGLSRYFKRSNKRTNWVLRLSWEGSAEVHCRSYWGIRHWLKTKRTDVYQGSVLMKGSSTSDSALSSKLSKIVPIWLSPPC